MSDSQESVKVATMKMNMCTSVKGNANFHSLDSNIYIGLIGRNSKTLDQGVRGH